MKDSETNIFYLKNKSILITGASSGIGRQCAITASHYGANLILVARNERRLQETKENLGKGNHQLFSSDITEYENLEYLIHQATQNVGKLDGFVHSAGIEITSPLRLMKRSLYERLFSVNVIAGFEIARIIAKKKFCNSNGASFVFMASIMGLLGEKGLVGYCASKGALISGCRSMALELSVKNIRVNCILPGHISGTKMTNDIIKILPDELIQSRMAKYPLGVGKPDDVANAVLFLLSDAARWITGVNLVVDGGYSLK